MLKGIREDPNEEDEGDDLKRQSIMDDKGNVDFGDNQDYPFKQLEDDLIKYICEKIVAMREQPFIDAVDNLRRAQELNNLQMIMEMQRNKSKWNQS